jgi:hypothetical protein
MRQDVCKKLVQLDENILQATLLDRSTVIESYMREDSPLEKRLPEKDEGFTSYLLAHTAKRNEEKFGGLIYEVIRYENAEIILVPVSGDFTLRLFVRPGSTTRDVIRRIGGIKMPTTAGTG